MSYQREREQFILAMAQEGMSPDVARLILRHANTYHRLAERECNGDDWQIGALVPCPDWKRFPGRCSTCGVDDLAIAAPASPKYRGHSKVSRSSVRMAQLERRINELVTTGPGEMVVQFNGDPRGHEVTICIGGCHGPQVGVPTRSR